MALELPKALSRARRPWRGLLVATMIAIGLAISVPNLATIIYGMASTFDFATCDGVICSVAGDASRAGIRIGDRLDLKNMAIADRYAAMSSQDPYAGQTVSLRLLRGERAYKTTQTAHRDPRPSDAWLQIVAGKVAVIVLVVLASALFLVNPTPVSSALALFAAISFGVSPYFYSFLPSWAYIGVETLSGLFVSAAVVGFLWLALTLGRDRQRPFPLALLVVFTLLVLLDVSAAVAPFWMGVNTTLAVVIQFIIVCCVVPGAALLLQTALRGNARPGERLAAALVAAAGIALVADWLCAAIANLALGHGASVIWQVLQGPAALLRQSLYLVSLVTAAAAAYVIVRERVVDSGLVGSRILSYGAILLGILAALGLLNWPLAPRLSSFPAAIPFEVIGAVAIGYWLSGFRDISNALALAAVDAPTAAMHGRRADENGALAHALGLAERTRQPSLIAEIRARCAFSAWVNCDDRAFEQHIDALRAALGSRGLCGLLAFAEAASGSETECVPVPSDLPEWTARSCLLLSARSDSTSEALDHANHALYAADMDGSPWLRVLTRVALAESSEPERDARLSEASDIALRSGAAALAKSLLALRADKRDCGMLQNFVDVRLRKFRAACPALEIEFFTGDVRVRGQQVEFSEKERALLFTVAATRSISPELLADALWPDSDGDAALNALKVCLHRLRRRAGDPRVVRRIGQAYSLHPGADVDLWRLDIVPSGAEPADLTAMREAFGTGTQKRATLGPWFSQFETLLARKLEEIEQSVASKSSGASAVMR